MKTFIENLKTYMQTDSTIKYVKIITDNEDIEKLVSAGKFPFINVKGDSIKYEDIEGFHPDIGEKTIYKIIIQFAVNHKEKKVSIMGTKDTKGIWELANDINTVINNYITSTKYDTSPIYINNKPTVFQRTWKMKDSKWMAGSELVIEFKQDDFE